MFQLYIANIRKNTEP